MKVVQVRSYTDPTFNGKDQPVLNTMFIFKLGETAYCKNHGVTRCNYCTFLAGQITDRKLRAKV